MKQTHSSPTITVVTPTYNRVALLKNAVQSILDQTVEGLEFIIIDDGSTDGTSAYLDTLPSRVKIVRLPNGGQVKALTAGWAQATSRYLTYLSDDDLLLPNALAKLVSHLEAHPRSAAVFPNANLIDLNGQVTQTHVGRQFSLRSLVTELQCFIGPGAVFRRNAYEAVGAWDDRCRLLPDLEFWTRLGLLGDIDFLPEVLALYRVHAGSLSVPANRSKLMTDEYTYVINKFYDSPACPPDLYPLKCRALANAQLIVARNYLRNFDMRALTGTLIAAYRLDRSSFNARATLQLAGAGVPLALKQAIRRVIRSRIA